MISSCKKVSVILMKIFVFSIAISPIIGQLNPCTEHSKELMPNPRGCSWYWRCMENKTTPLDDPVEERCDEGQHFDYYNQTCGEFDQTCTYDDDLFNRTPQKCTPWRQDLIPHLINCDQYYMCWQDERRLETCPEGEHFSYFQNGCTSEFLADCRTEHNYCRVMKEYDIEVQRDPFSCSTYHVCNECNNRYSLIKLNCVNSTHYFDDDTKQCNDIDRVNCTILDDGTGGSTPPPEFWPPMPHSIQCSRDDIINEFVIHPESCFYFFNCASGRSTLYQCPEGSYFDIEKGQCWAHGDGFECPESETTSTVSSPTYIR